MARPLRLEFPGALFHVTSRGNERKPIFRCDADRLMFLTLLAEAVRRFDWMIHAYVLMTNHFHLVIETPRETLSEGMHWLNGTYAQWFNRKYKRVGHLLQGRFSSFLIEKEAYLAEVMRYVVLNPVRAKMVELPEQYRWSSYRAMAGFEPAPEWLCMDWMLRRGATRDEAQENYRAFVYEKLHDRSRLWDKLVNQIYLGTEPWVESMRAIVEEKPRSDEHPKTQRTVGRAKLGKVVETIASVFDIDESEIRHGRGGAARMMTAWLGRYESAERLRPIAATLRLGSTGHVSNLIARCERELVNDRLLRDLADRCLASLLAGNSDAAPPRAVPIWPMLPPADVIRDSPGPPPF